MSLGDGAQHPAIHFISCARNPAVNLRQRDQSPENARPLSQKAAVPLQGERHAPGDANQAFRFRAFDRSPNPDCTFGRWLLRSLRGWSIFEDGPLPPL